MPDSLIQLGIIGRPHGVRGLVRITSYTADPTDLTAYGPLSDAEGRTYVLRWKAEGVAEVTRITNGLAVRISDRAQAEKLTNIRLYIERSRLPPADHDEYYLADLIGLKVICSAGISIGQVSVVHDYGAGVSLEIDGSSGPLLVPFTAACIPSVDIAAGLITVIVPDEVIVMTKAKHAT